MVNMSKQTSMLSFFNSGSVVSSQNVVREGEANSDRLPSNSGNEAESEAVKTKRKKSSFNRKYNESYLAYGFIPTGCDDAPSPQCVVCGLTMSNEAMKPSKLLRHFNTKHPQLRNKPLDFFKRKKIEFNTQKKVIKSASQTSQSELKASFLIALRIAQMKKPFTIGEDLVMPCIIDACREVLGETAAVKMRKIPLSNDTVCRRINMIADDLEEQLINKLSSSPYFATQLDESTDISNKAVLLVYVRYVDFTESDMKEELLSTFHLPTNTTSTEVFRAIDEYLKEKGVSWEKCIGTCTDGAAAMTGKHSGVVKKMKDVSSPDFKGTHCFIHREMLASKKMCPEFSEVLTQSVKIVNFIRANALNSRVFEVLCNEMGSNHSHLLLHAEVRWLSRGKVLSRLFELRKEVEIFLKQKKSVLVEPISTADWQAKLAYLADIFGHLNDLNVSMQGTMMTVFKMADKIDGFKNKVRLWRKRIIKTNECFEMFPLFSELWKNDVVFNKAKVAELIQNHLISLEKYFDENFPAEDDIRVGNEWIINPFTATDTTTLSLRDAELLAGLTADSSLKLAFSNQSLCSFWVSARNEYSSLCDRALKVLLPFPSTYLCESGFSVMANTKTRQRNRLNISKTLRVSLSKLSPRIDRLVANVQAQASH